MNTITPEIISIPKEIAINTKKAVAEKLGVGSTVKLNDRIDGITFYTKNLKRIIGAYCIEKEFKIELINPKNILLSSNEFTLKNRYCILSIEPKEELMIPKGENITFIVVQLLYELKRATILGQITSEECLKHCQPSYFNILANKDMLGVLKDLSHLQPINIF